MCLRHSHILTAFSLLFTYIIGWGQTTPISKISVPQGLSNSYAVSLALDSYGNVWAATEEGLNRIDGCGVASYYSNPTAKEYALSGDALNAVLADGDRLWVGTQRDGLCAYDILTGQFKTYSHVRGDTLTIATNDVTALAPGPEPGQLWVGTYHRGVELMDKATGQFEHFNIANYPDLPSNQIRQLLSDPTGLLYIGHYNDGLSVLNPANGQIVTYNAAGPEWQRLPGDKVTALERDPMGNIWIGTDQGLAVLNPLTHRVTPMEIPGLSTVPSSVSAIRCAGTHMYVAFELWGVYAIDTHRADDAPHLLRHGMLPGELGGSTVRDILVDDFGNVWFATWGGGVNFLSHIAPWFGQLGGTGELATQINARQTALSLACHNGKVLVGSDGNGLLVYEGDKCIDTHKRGPEDLGANYIMAINRDSQGRWWEGTYGGGLRVVDADGHQQKLLDVPTDVRSIVERGSEMWVATTGGIYVLDAATGAVKRHLTPDNSPITDHSVRTLAFDFVGNLWVGTFSYGLFELSPDGQLLGRWTKDNGVNNDIRHLLTDRHGHVWAATSSGLARFSRDGLDKIYGTEQGMASASIHALAEDSEGNVWFSTNRGIGSVACETDSVTFHTFAEGISPSEFLDRSVATDTDGTIYFGSSTGVFYFHPRYLSSNLSAPGPRFTNMKVVGDLTNADSEIPLYGRKSVTLQPDQNTFSVSFDNTDYALAGKVHYAYRLLGLDDNWRLAEGDNELTFRNLPHGKYTLELRSRLNNASWGPVLADLAIKVTPPFYLSIWAKLIYVLLIAAGIWFIDQSFKKRLQLQNSYELERQKLVFFTNITHELRTPLTLIVGPLEDMKHDTEMPQKYRDKLDLIHQSALKLLDLINEILEFRKIETQNRQLCVRYGDLSKVIRNTGLKYQELNKNPQTKLEVKIGEGDWHLYFDREAVTSIIDNLLSNAIKYTPAGRITLSLQRVPDSKPAEIAISVSDTGYGIDPKQLPHVFERYYQGRGEHQAPGTGIGLALAKSLAELHQGRITVESEVGKGSVFTLYLLADNSYPDALHVDDNQSDQPLSQAEEPERDADGRKPVLLIVEDNPDIIHYIALSFASHFDILTAANGRQGLEKAYASIPDIIVSDVMMPEMDGIEMCRALKSDVRTSHIPIILLTAKNTLSDKEEGYRAGADSYLTKPFSSSLLHSRINNLLEVRRNMAAQMVESVSLTTAQESAQDIDNKKKMASESINQIDADFLNHLTQIIEKNIGSEKLNIDLIASEMCMGPSSLYRKMRALTGISTTEYIRRVRMRHAEELLLQRQYSVSEIAFMLGFSAPSYFRQCFKEEFGCTPTEFIKRTE
ncbi:MAG: response regulator [Bacteroidales bacterium]|nr:response regulator [Bacteroidales bacterium]